MIKLLRLLLALNLALVAGFSTADARVLFDPNGNGKFRIPSLSNLPPAVGTTLQVLSISPATSAVGAAYSGTITGKTSGSTITLGNTGAAGLSVSGSSVTGTPTTAGAVDLIETLAGATNTPRTTSASLNVSASATVGLSNTNATAGSQYTGTIQNLPAGSTATAASSDGQNFVVTGSTVKGTFALSGSPTLTLSVTPSGGGTAQTYPITMAVASPNYPFGTQSLANGDSITDQAYSAGGLLGYYTRAIAKTAGRYIVPPMGNRGSAGQTAANAVMDQGTFQNLLSTGTPGVVVFNLGTNYDANEVAELRSQVDLALAAGWRPIVMTIYVSNKTFINPAILSWTDVTVVRGDLLITNLTTQTADNTHPNDAGAELLAAGNGTIPGVATVMNDWSGAKSQDIYTNDVTSSVPDFGGTPYTVTATGVSGQMPAGWNIQRFAGDGTIATSIVQVDGLPALNIAITGGTTATRALVIPASQPTVVANDVVDAWMEYRVTSGPASEFWLSMATGGGSFVGGTPGWDINLLNAWAPYRMYVRAAPGSQPFYIFGSAGAAKSATFQYRRPRFTKRVVPDFPPRGYFAGGQRPQVTGTAKVGSTLTAVPQTWSGKPITLTVAYTWVYADGTTVPGSANQNTYVQVSADQGKQITCNIDETNTAGTTRYTPALTAAVSP